MTEQAYAAVLETSDRVRWEIEDVLPDGATLDVDRPFLPDAIAATPADELLSSSDRLHLNQIRGRSYTGLFGAMEEVIVPFLGVIAPELAPDSPRTRALLQFGDEEDKHTRLFQRFGALYDAAFATEHQIFEIAAAQRGALQSFHPLALALLTLHIEVMTQKHFADSVRDDGGLDPLFARMLRFHWLEESQHVRIDELLIAEVVARLSDDETRRGVSEYVGSVGLLSAMISMQVGYDIAALERWRGRDLLAGDREAITRAHKRSFKTAFIGAGVGHPRFRRLVEGLAPGAGELLQPLLPAPIPARG